MPFSTRYTLFFFLIFPLLLIASPSIFPIKDIKPGLKGECRTVFSGIQIQSFPFEVMGVAKDFIGPSHDVIWCKMTGDPTNQMVVAAGMSGSPCYVDGRMIGALAYGVEFNKDPIFGVQPIESMLEILKFSGNECSDTYSSLKPHRSEIYPQSSGTPFFSSLKTWTCFKNPIFHLSSGNALTQMSPLPLEINGLHPLIADYISQGMSEAGFFPQMAAGGGGGLSKIADNADLIPGSALTGVIATGDLNIAATGTLSWKDGDQILAFGHPFLGIGAVNIPMGKAEIIGVISSYKHSTKMSNQGNIIGTLTQDRISAVGGRIGLIPKMTPMTVNIRRSTFPARSYKVEFCDNKFFTPIVYQIALLQFLANTMERSEETTLKLKSEIQIDGLPSLRFEDVFTGEQFSWVFGAILSPSMQLMPLYQNEFNTPIIRSISIDAEITPTVHHIILEEMFVDPLKAYPGDKIRIRAGFRPWHGKRFYHDYEMILPEEVKDGEVELILTDAPHMDQLMGRSTAESPYNGTLSPGNDLRNFGQLIRALNNRSRKDHLYMVLQRKSNGLSIQNQRLTSLPQSIQKLLTPDQNADTGHTTFLSDAILSKTEIGFDSVIEGNCSVKIKIQ